MPASALRHHQGVHIRQVLPAVTLPSGVPHKWTPLREDSAFANLDSKTGHLLHHLNPVRETVSHGLFHIYLLIILQKLRV